MKYTLLFVFGLLIGSVGAMDTEVTPGDVVAVAVVPLGVVGGLSEAGGPLAALQDRFPRLCSST